MIELYLGGSLFFSDSLSVTQFFYKWGVIPRELTSGNEITQFEYFVREGEYISRKFLDVRSQIPIWGTIFSSMFIHGGWLHLIGNMVYLWVFGRNIEDRFGHLKFLMIYLIAGIIAVFAQTYIAQDSLSPMVGASGAIAGISGAYLILFPFARIKTLILFFFIMAIDLPAVLLLGFWFLLQFFQGVGSLGTLEGGVAYWAHVGGFLAGIAAALLYKLIRREPLWSRGLRSSRRINPYEFPSDYYNDP